MSTGGRLSVAFGAVNRSGGSVSGGLLDVTASEICLKCLGIVSSVGQHVAAGMAYSDSTVATDSYSGPAATAVAGEMRALAEGIGLRLGVWGWRRTERRS